MYQLDFDQVANAGLRSRHRPTILVAYLPAHIRQTKMVEENKRERKGVWHLPLTDSYVRAWLKKQLFPKPPSVWVGGAEVSCSKPATEFLHA